MKEKEPTCFSCNAHTDDYLRIITKTNKAPTTCKSCGFKLEGKFGYLCCRICTANHILRNVLSLKHIATNELYLENKFNCHGCKTKKDVGEKGVMLC